MRDRITANLPAISFDQTVAFYGVLGFVVNFRDDHWMIMSRGDLEIEFFPHPDLKPSESWFSACVRVGDVDALYHTWNAVGLQDKGIPRLTKPPTSRRVSECVRWWTAMAASCVAFRHFDYGRAES